MSTLDGKCETCGKFASGKGASYAAIFDFVDMACSHEAMRCRRCTERLGPVKSNARPHDGDTSRWEWLQP